MPAKTFIDRPDLLDSESPPGLRVVQLTADADHPFCHVYMEAQVFSSDSQRFLIRRSRMAHNHTLNDPDYQYHLCDLDAQEISPLTNELNVCAPSFSPDDQWVYYLTDDAQSGGAVALRRVRPDGTGRETLRVYDQPLSGADVPLRLIYPLSTMSSDGRYLVTGAGVGVERDPWGIVRFDLATGEAMVIWRDPFIRNSHPQYCRSHDPQRRRDLLIQQNHGQLWDTTTGETLAYGHDPGGADVHVIRDDGGDLRTMPWGRDGSEYCQGHQCWRGRSGWAITSTMTYLPKRQEGARMECRLIESQPVAEAGHIGSQSPDAVRHFLSVDTAEPMFYHFATDIEGTRLISDFWHPDGRETLYLFALDKPGRPPKTVRYLLNTRTAKTKDTHSHPFLSPDGRRAFFNSNESGNLQAYMIENLPL
ncbi:MAG: hypothetical protein GXY33_20105 [Phycisphaerae bacterium]|nr:hypothetical protein [Phycisphaerae bacterium]